MTWLKPEVYQNEKELDKKVFLESPIKAQIQESRKKIAKLEELVSIVEEKLEEIKNKEENARYFFLTYEDIKLLNNQDPENILIAVTVPEDVQVEMLEVDNKNEVIQDTNKEMIEPNKESMENSNETPSKNHQIYFYSNTGGINAYLLMNSNRKAKDSENEEEAVRNYDPLCSSGRNFNSNDSPDSPSVNFAKNFLSFSDGFIN